MTQEKAIELAAAMGDGYRARKLRGRWCVWCDDSDHVVDFGEPEDIYPREDV